ERDELRVFYQPVVDLADESVAEVEALVRWQHPTLGLIGPNEFIGVAEETGLVVALGEWVLREACRELARGYGIFAGEDVGLSVVAEGVESEDELITLRALRCDRAQGYYWSRPLPAHELLDLELGHKRTAPAPINVWDLLVERTKSFEEATGRAVVVQVPLT